MQTSIGAHLQTGFNLLPPEDVHVEEDGVVEIVDENSEEMDEVEHRSVFWLSDCLHYTHYVTGNVQKDECAEER